MAAPPPRALDPQPPAQMPTSVRVVPPAMGAKWVGVGVLVLIGTLLIKSGHADAAIPTARR